jgi:hypothetical protein
MISVYIESVSRDRSFLELKSVLRRFSNIQDSEHPQDADVVVLTDDDHRLINQSEVFRKFRSKCVIVSDGDIFSYYLPALYAANYENWLGRGRALTCNYYSALFESEGKRNIWIDKLRESDEKKLYLYSFMGGSTAMIRKRLYKQYEENCPDDVIIQATDHYRHGKEDTKNIKDVQQKRYVQTMLASKFALCPRGAGRSSIRLFEAMELGIAPVVLADRWIPVDGIDWSFCIFVKESDLRDLDAIVRSHSEEWQKRGRAARAAFEQNFAGAQLGATLERQLRQLVANRSDRLERKVALVYPVYRLMVEAKANGRAALRGAILAMFKLTGRKFPYHLNR